MEYSDPYSIDEKKIPACHNKTLVSSLITKCTDYGCSAMTSCGFRFMKDIIK